MKGRTVHYKAMLICLISAMALAGCGERLPPEAKTAVLRGFEREEKPRIASARRAKPLPEDLDLGAEEVWCVNITFACWSCAHLEWRTCADSRLVRLIDGQWQVVVVRTDEDKEKWEARGCELMEDVVSGY